MLMTFCSETFPITKKGVVILLGSGEKGHPYVGKKGPLAVGKKRPKSVG